MDLNQNITSTQFSFNKYLNDYAKDNDIDVSKYVNNLIINNPEYKQAAIDHQLRALNREIIFRHQSLKKIFIKQILSEEDKNRLINDFPEYNISFDRAEDNVGHVYARAHRKLSYHLLMDSFKGTELSNYDMKVKCVGSNPIYHILNEHDFVHCCVPVLSYTDVIRDSDYEIFKREMYDLSAKSKSILLEHQNNNVKFICRNKSEDCLITAPYVLFMHSVYDISIKQLAEILFRSDCMLGAGCFIFSLDILFATRGFLKDIGIYFEKYYDKKNKKIFIRFYFGSGDTQNGYVHEYEQYLQYLTTFVIKHTTPSKKDYYWNYVITSIRSSVIYFKITRVFTPIKESHVFRTLPIKNIDDMLVITYYEMNSDYNNVANNYSCLKKNRLLVPRSFHENVLSYYMQMRDGTKTIEQLTAAVVSFNNRMTINGNTITTPQKIDPLKLKKYITAMYTYMYIVNYEDTQVLSMLLTSEERLRSYNKKNFFSRIISKSPREVNFFENTLNGKFKVSADGTLQIKEKSFLSRLSEETLNILSAPFLAVYRFFIGLASSNREYPISITEMFDVIKIEDYINIDSFEKYQQNFFNYNNLPNINLAIDLIKNNSNLLEGMYLQLDDYLSIDSESEKNYINIVEKNFNLDLFHTFQDHFNIDEKLVEKIKTIEAQAMLKSGQIKDDYDRLIIMHNLFSLKFSLVVEDKYYNFGQKYPQFTVHSGFVSVKFIYDPTCKINNFECATIKLIDLVTNLDYKLYKIFRSLDAMDDKLRIKYNINKKKFNPYLNIHHKWICSSAMKTKYLFENHISVDFNKLRNSNFVFSFGAPGGEIQYLLNSGFKNIYTTTITTPDSIRYHPYITSSPYVTVDLLHTQDGDLTKDDNLYYYCASYAMKIDYFLCDVCAGDFSSTDQKLLRNAVIMATFSMKIGARGYIKHNLINEYTIKCLIFLNKYFSVSLVRVPMSPSTSTEFHIVLSRISKNAKEVDESRNKLEVDINQFFEQLVNKVLNNFDLILRSIHYKSEDVKEIKISNQWLCPTPVDANDFNYIDYCSLTYINRQADIDKIKKHIDIIIKNNCIELKDVNNMEDPSNTKSIFRRLYDNFRNIISFEKKIESDHFIGNITEGCIVVIRGDMTSEKIFERYCKHNVDYLKILHKQANRKVLYINIGEVVIMIGKNFNNLIFRDGVNYYLPFNYKNYLTYGPDTTINESVNTKDNIKIESKLTPIEFNDQVIKDIIEDDKPNKNIADIEAEVPVDIPDNSVNVNSLISDYYQLPLTGKNIYVNAANNMLTDSAGQALAFSKLAKKILKEDYRNFFNIKTPLKTNFNSFSFENYIFVLVVAENYKQNNDISKMIDTFVSLFANFSRLLENNPEHRLYLTAFGTEIFGGCLSCFKKQFNVLQKKYGERVILVHYNFDNYDNFDSLKYCDHVSDITVDNKEKQNIIHTTDPKNLEVPKISRTSVKGYLNEVTDLNKLQEIERDTVVFKTNGDGNCGMYALFGNDMTKNEINNIYDRMILQEKILKDTYSDFELSKLLTFKNKKFGSWLSIDEIALICAEHSFNLHVHVVGNKSIFYYQNYVFNSEFKFKKIKYSSQHFEKIDCKCDFDILYNQASINEYIDYCKHSITETAKITKDNYERHISKKELTLKFDINQFRMNTNQYFLVIDKNKKLVWPEKLHSFNIDDYKFFLSDGRYHKIEDLQLYVKNNPKSPVLLNLFCQHGHEIDIVERFSDATAINLTVNATQAGPGCGKTHDLIATYKSNNSNALVVAESNAQVDDLNIRLGDGCPKAKTIMSALLNNNATYDVVYVDESFKVHIGQLLLLASVCKAKVLDLRGDVLQIQFNSRYLSFVIRNNSISNYANVNLRALYETYRCPADVCATFSKEYQEVHNKYGVDRTLLTHRTVDASYNVVRISSPKAVDDIISKLCISDQRNRSKYVFLFFTYDDINIFNSLKIVGTIEYDKKKKNGHVANVFTIDSYQGRECENVFIFRFNTIVSNTFYRDKSRVLSALTRHKATCTYYTVMHEDDYIVEKIRESTELLKKEKNFSKYKVKGGHQYIETIDFEFRDIGEPRYLNFTTQKFKKLEYIHDVVYFNDQALIVNSFKDLYKLNQDLNLDGKFIISNELLEKFSIPALVYLLHKKFPFSKFFTNKNQLDLIPYQVNNAMNINNFFDSPLTELTTHREYFDDFTTDTTLPEIDLGYLQHVLNVILDGNSHVDTTFDQYNLHNIALDFQINERITITPHKGIFQFSKFDRLTPVLKAPVSGIRKHTQKEVIVALNKRNFAVPFSDLVVDFETISNEMVDLLFDYCLEPLWVHDKFVTDITSREILDWLSDQPPFVIDNIDFPVMLEMMDLAKHNLSIKTSAKILYPIDVSNYAALQTIVNPAAFKTAIKAFNLIFCTIFRKITNILLKHLKKNFLIFTKMNNKQFQNLFTRNYHELYKLFKFFFEGDIAKFDKSQGLLMLLFECKFMLRLGISERLVNIWFASHLVKELNDVIAGISTTIFVQRTSGDPATFIGNSVFLLMCLVHYLIKIKKIRVDDFAVVVAGDDNLVFTNLVDKDNFNSTRFKEIYNLEWKMLSYNHYYFCSKFMVPDAYGQFFFVPDPIKLLLKLTRKDMINYEHVEEYRISLGDLSNAYNNQNILNTLSNFIHERYKIPFNTTYLIRQIIALSSKENFLKLFTHDDTQNIDFSIKFGKGILKFS